MSVYYVIPSKRPIGEALHLAREWAALGYDVVLQRDIADADEETSWMRAKTQIIYRQYKGYAEAVNYLVQFALQDPTCSWIVTGGDDVHPERMRLASHIAIECTDHFEGTFGVMQPTGDRWGENDVFARHQWPDAPAYIDRVCGSPWMGREFCERMYGGKGPLWEGWFHMRVDEELQEVAKKLGVLWQRRDLKQYHAHAQRIEGTPVPEFLQYVYSPKHWEETTKLFEERKAAGFPGHEPLEVKP